jgi:hypothetical protein
MNRPSWKNSVSGEFLQEVLRLVSVRDSRTIRICCGELSPQLVRNPNMRGPRFNPRLHAATHGWATAGRLHPINRRRCAPIRGATVILDISPLIAIEINASHAAAAASAQEAVNHARRCGELLARVKDSLPHGSWLPWLDEHCNVRPRQAQRYIRLYKNWDTLAAKATREMPASLNEAMALLASPKRIERTGRVVAKESALHVNETEQTSTPVTTVKVVTIERFDGTWKGYIVPHTDPRYAFVSVVQWSKDGGTIDGMRKAIIRTAADEVLRHLFGIANHNWSSADVNESDSHFRWSYNQFLFDSHDDYVQQVVLGR